MDLRSGSEGSNFEVEGEPLVKAGAEIGDPFAGKFDHSNENVESSKGPGPGKVGQIQIP